MNMRYKRVDCLEGRMRQVVGEREIAKAKQSGGVGRAVDKKVNEADKA